MSFGVAARARVAPLLCIDALLKLTNKGSPRPDRVLIVRLDAIGDFILWLDSAPALAEHYTSRGKSVVLVANAAWAAWARDLTAFKDIVAVDVKEFQRNPLYRYRIGREIRTLGCDIAVNPTYSRDWFLDDFVIRISGARERIGSTGDSSKQDTWQRRMSNRWYTRLLPADPAPYMELERNAEFLHNLGEINFRAKQPRLDTAKAARTDDAFTSTMAGRPYYVLFPGASRKGKQWPVSNFVQVAETLYSRTGWQGVVCGGPSDLALADDLCRQSTVPLLNWAGRTDLAQLTAILSAAQLLLSNDTSAAHIGPACGVPTVCLLGGGHYGRFMPYHVDQATDRPLPRAVIHKMPCFGCDWRCIYKPSPEDPVPCIEQISVNDAWNAIGEALGLNDMDPSESRKTSL